MKGVVLVGGEGTRLRPLTVNKPKPMAPIANEPFLARMIRYLKKFGIDEIILAMGYLPDRIRQHLGDGESLGVKLIYSVEDHPLGTAGAVKLAEPYIGGETCFVFNGDVLCDLDLGAMLAHHRRNQSQLTIALTPVDNPSQYGVVETDAAGRIVRFIEKPPAGEAPSNYINAGTYVMEPEVLASIPTGQFYMYEYSVFPGLLAAGAPLYAFSSDDYWIDIGAPAKYLAVNHDYLSGKLKGHAPAGPPVGPETKLADDVEIIEPVLIGARCRIEAGASLQGPLVIGDDCVVRAGARVAQSVLWDRVEIGPGAQVRGAIVATGARILGSALEGTVIGDEAVIEEENVLANGARLWTGAHLPRKTITF